MISTRYSRMCGLIIVLGQFASPCVAAIRTETQKIVASGPPEYADSFKNYGYSAALSGETAIIGASAEGGGSAYVYQRDPSGIWNQVTRLIAPEPIREFGFSVAIEGDLALVGARGVGSVGAVYAFARNSIGNWQSAGKLQALDPVQDALFGSDVSLSGDVAVVGANYDDARGPESGAAYFFQRTGFDQWTQTTKVTGSDIRPFSYFGESVSVDGNLAVIGSFGDRAAYVFQRDGLGQWSQLTTLRASDESFSSRFGLDVSIDGSMIAVGGPDPYFSSRSSTYVFEEDPMGNWVQTAQLFSPNAPSAGFGGSVAIGGDLVIVGDGYEGGFRGAAYTFQKDADGSWQLVSMLQASDGRELDILSRVALDGRTAVVGAWKANAQGAAYLYENVPEPNCLLLLVTGGASFLVSRRR